MIEYYFGLVKETNETCFINCFTGFALITDQGFFTMELKESPLKLSSVPNSNRKHRGNPLDVILLTEDGRYFYDLSDDECIELGKKGEKDFMDFIISKLL